MVEPPVASGVFDFIDDFIAANSVWSVTGSIALDPHSNVLAFCENFFAQFFQNELHTEISSLTGISAQRAGVLRRQSSTTDGQRVLIRRFQHLCKIHGDLVGETYGTGGDERADFFYADLPRLLDAIKRWALDAGYSLLGARAERTIASYPEFIDETPPMP
jgi:hypothetical protein